MNKKLKILREKFKYYGIDGYIVPKNDDYFTEYSKINRLKIISNFSGSAGLAVILKKKNYLFTDGRYTIQSQIESGKNFKIISYEKIINCDLFKGLILGVDPKLITYNQAKKFFLKKNKIKYIDNNLIDQIESQKIKDNFPFFTLNKNIVGESHVSKINKKKPLYRYCRSGNRSSRAANQIAVLGFEKIYDLKGGYMKRRDQ